MQLARRNSSINAHLIKIGDKDYFLKLYFILEFQRIFSINLNNEYFLVEKFSTNINSQMIIFIQMLNRKEVLNFFFFLDFKYLHSFFSLS